MQQRWAHNSWHPPIKIQEHIDLCHIVANQRRTMHKCPLLNLEVTFNFKGAGDVELVSWCLYAHAHS